MQESFSLFAEPTESSETLQALNAELLRRVEAAPQFKERILIYGEGEPGARVAVVGESPGPPDIATGQIGRAHV